MTCRYCGVETGSGAGHRSQAECIKALSEEIDRAKRLIHGYREGGGRPAETRRASSADHHVVNQ